MRAADLAANQSDRWLFMAMLTVNLLTLLGAIRWIISDRKSIGDRLTKITDQQIVQTERMAVVIANNTDALHQVSTEIQHCRDLGRDRHC